MSLSAFQSDDDIRWDDHWVLEQAGAKDFGGQDARQVYNYAVPYLPLSPFKVLEVGCGIGKWSPLWIQLGATYEGLDASPAAIMEARKQYPDLSFYLGRAEDFTAHSNYDVIYTHTCLQHCKEPTKRRILPRWHEALKPHGLLVLEENANDGNTETTYTPQGWRELIEPFGFEYLKYSEDSRNGFIFRRTT